MGEEKQISKPAISASRLRESLKMFKQPDRLRSVWQLVNTLVPYVLAWVASAYALTYSFWLALPFILILTGFQLRTFIIFHDCGHQSFFKSRKVNDFWGRLTGVLTFAPYYFWTNSHAKHHATSANLDKRGVGDIWMMTVKEFEDSPRSTQIKYRLYRNPLVMLLLGPLLLLVLEHRFGKGRVNSREKKSIFWTNVGIAIMALPICYFVSWQAFLLIQVLSLYLVHILGVWLFYVQHQFEGVYWERDNNWDFMAASLEGGSFYDLPALFRWFTGSIGYHHVHHLDSRIPNYNLSRCHEGDPTLKSIKPVKLFSSLKAINFRLWDEKSRQMVGFSSVRKRLKTGSKAA